jgi:2-C-methyl-D-erythritol 2,4-cyclodiphosphate synthase
MNWRIGFGYDVHQLAEGEKLIVGGVEIAHHKGSVGHSDADVLIHALCDALLGAANLGDIGTHFPDNDDRFKNIDSRILLEQVVELLINNQYKIGNIDSTICLQQPRIKPYIPKMREKLAQSLQLDESNISIKATTTERLGFVGNEEGISAYAVVLINK